jgi:hypothetical protein
MVARASRTARKIRPVPFSALRFQLSQNALLPTSALVLSFRRETSGKIIIEVVRVPSAGPSGGKGELSLNKDNQLVFAPL